MSGAAAPWTLATIGYEGTIVPRFLEALREAGVQRVVDVRAVASSRRPGFAKTRLAENLATAGIAYLHLRDLGTPAEGRAAARGGRIDELHRIFLAHLATPAAQDALDSLAELVRAGERSCLLCFEADPRGCHRNLVAAALSERMPLHILHLAPGRPDEDEAE